MSNKTSCGASGDRALTILNKLSPLAGRLVSAGFSRPEAIALLAAIDYVPITKSLEYEYGDTTICALRSLKNQINEERLKRRNGGAK